MAIQITYQPCLPVEDVCRIDAECFPGEPLEPQAFAEAVQQDFWAALEGGTLAGYAHVVRRPGVALLARIGTAAAYRRRGVATALMRAALEHCRRIGLPETILYVETDNTAAMRIYERFGFRAVERYHQYLFAHPREQLRAVDAAGITAVPIGEAPASALPDFPREWTGIAGMHRPPETYVFVFRQSGESVGYCRLTPGFPGCFPFMLERPTDRLMPALRSIRDYLRPDKAVLKLTVWDPALTAACRHAGLELNYELHKMLRRPGS